MRKGAAWYAVTALPVLGELGSTPPMALGELREMLADEPWTLEPVDAVLLLDDRMQRESFLAGESTDVAPTVLTPEQACNEAPLPGYLQAGDEDAEKASASLEVDRLWSTYFRYVVGLSRRSRCPFLEDWARFEVALRNALATARAERLGLAAEDYRVATELEDDEVPLEDVVNDWARAENPVSGYNILLRTRWEWTSKHERWFSFRADELAAYALKLMLLHQAYRISAREEQVHQRGTDSTQIPEVDTR